MYILYVNILLRSSTLDQELRRIAFDLPPVRSPSSLLFSLRQPETRVKHTCQTREVSDLTAAAIRRHWQHFHKIERRKGRHFASAKKSLGRCPFPIINQIAWLRRTLFEATDSLSRSSYDLSTCPSVRPAPNSISDYDRQRLAVFSCDLG